MLRIAPTPSPSPEGEGLKTASHNFSDVPSPPGDRSKGMLVNAGVCPRGLGYADRRFAKLGGVMRRRETQVRFAWQQVPQSRTRRASKGDPPFVISD